MNVASRRLRPELLPLELGLFALVTGRNLLAPILAHGIGNSIDFTVMYFGQYPGVGSWRRKSDRRFPCERVTKVPAERVSRETACPARLCHLELVGFEALVHHRSCRQLVRLEIVHVDDLHHLAVVLP